jgi:hypothetical protein
MVQKLFLLLMAGQLGLAAKAQYSDYEYSLNFELDSKTGKYRPAYSYKSTKGNSTIWLDGANKNKAASSAAKKNEPKLLIGFKWPPLWKVSSNTERAKAVHTDSSSFTIFASRPFTGTPSGKDLISEWNKRCRSQYGEITEKDIINSPFKNGGVYFMYVKAREKGAALAIIYSGSRAVPVLLEFPSAELFRLHRKEMKDFLESVEIKTGVIDPA